MAQHWCRRWGCDASDRRPEGAFSRSSGCGDGRSARDDVADRVDGHVGADNKLPESAGGETPVGSTHKVPVVAIADGAAALAGVARASGHYLVQTAGLLAAAACLLVAVFVVVDWRIHAAVLPPSVLDR